MYNLSRAISCLIFILSFSFIYAQKPKLVFSAHWMPQAQFAGYYVAKDQGFYEQAGLDIEIIHPSASVNATTFLAEGRADIISLFLITGIHTKQKGLDLVNIAQFSQHSAILFVSKKTSGIEAITDFNGKKVGVWKSGFEEVPKAVLDKHGQQVEWIPILSTVNLFLLGGIDVMTVMWYNEYNQIYLSGINNDELNTFFMADYGYDIPEDGLYVMRQTAESRSDDLRAFVEATMRGWEYAAQHKEYTIDLVVKLMRDAKIPSNKAHQRWMLDKVLEMLKVDGEDVQPTELHPGDFEKALEIVKYQQSPDFQLEFNDFYRPVLDFRQNTHTP